MATQVLCCKIWSFIAILQNLDNCLLRWIRQHIDVDATAAGTRPSETVKAGRGQETEIRNRTVMTDAVGWVNPVCE